MNRIDFHIVRTARGWHLQDAGGNSIGRFRSGADAFEVAREKARALEARGIHARVTVHNPGKTPDVFEFSGATS